MSKPRLYLVDATAFCYRAFYAIKGLSTSSGQPTGAVYGFLNILNKVVKDNKPKYMAVCFDVSRDTFRQKKFADYKIQRPAMPDELKSQMQFIKDIVSFMGIPLMEKEGFEADDVIATLADKAKEEGCAVTVISSDKDLLQLVSSGVELLNPNTEEGPYDEKMVLEKTGIKPSQIPDLIALAGDSADNIPSVPGISEKRAAQLVGEFGSAEGLIKNADKIKPEKLKASVEENVERIKLNKELAVLDKEVELGVSCVEELKIKEPDYDKLFDIYKKLEFRKFLKELPAGSKDKIDSAEVKNIDDRMVAQVIGKGREIAVSLDAGGGFMFSSAAASYLVDEPASQSRKLLSDEGIKKYGHDLKKIKVALQRRGIGLEGLSFDTMIAAYLVNPSRPSYNITDLAWDFLGKDISGQDDSRGLELSLVELLKPRLEEELGKMSLEELFYKTEMPLIEVLASMEENGIRLDVAKLKALSRSLEKRLSGIIEEIYRLCGCQFNINSPKQLREVLFEKLKLPVIKRTKTGPSTDEEVLKALAKKHELAGMLLEYRQLTKLKSTYIDALPELVDPATGCVHTSFNQTGTETGRLSSSKPNLQNLPIRTELGRSIREAVIPSDGGNVLLSCDYSQIELRVMAHMSKDGELVRAFKSGEDVHALTASLVYSVDKNEVTEEMRETAKRINFGIIYGLSAYGLSRDLGITQAQAQGFIDSYFLRYTGVKDYIERTISEAETQGFVTTILGRRRYLPEIKSKNQALRQLAQRQAVNTPIQGSASDLIKLAMVKIYSRIKKEGYRSRMVLQIHDELLFDVEHKELHKFGMMVKDTMESVLKLDVPVKVDVKYGKDWSAMSGLGS